MRAETATAYACDMTENRTSAEIAADIAATRDRLVANLDELTVRSQPEQIAAVQLERLKSFYLDEYGAIRMDRAAKTVGVVLGLAVLRKLFK